MFVSLAHHPNVEVLLVQVLDEQAGGVAAGVGADLGGAGAGIKEQQDEGAVAEGSGAAVGTLAFAGAGVGLAAFAGFEEGLDVGAAERLDDGLLGLGWDDGADDVVIGQALFDGPGPQCGEADVDVTNGLIGEAARGTGGDAGGGDGPGAEVGEEAADVVGGDVGQGGVSDEGLEFGEAVGVVGDGFDAEVAGASIEEVALDGLGKGYFCFHP